MSYTSKLKSAFPWLVRYPIWRGGEMMRRGGGKSKHVIFTIANHFEPAWSDNGALDIDSQRRRLDDWHLKARAIGESVRDSDGTKFRHTNFYPAEQYDYQLLETLAAIESEGLGETEVHLHHGVEKPDTAENLRRQLTDFRDCLANEHKLLSRFNGDGEPKYAFVHGNLALGNSANGKYCGVDSELQILAETGCYADFTLPSAPDETQVPKINSIYQASGDFMKAVPHKTGENVRVGTKIEKLPLIVNGALVFNWSRRIKGLPVPRLDDGALVANQAMDLTRFYRWKNANISVIDKPEWIFVKLYCHGFFDYDMDSCIGERAKRFFSEIIQHGAKTDSYQVHFASARETFNMICAAANGEQGAPNDFRDYRLKQISNENNS
ncbi:MAG: hypothetical protein H7Z37_15350 [Pyrinomonadaceae bacterium]|nr:hypothetical protein [Pyrinomonadaceae bacterium]